MTTAPGDLRDQIARYIDAQADRMEAKSLRDWALAYRVLASNIRARLDEVDHAEAE